MGDYNPNERGPGNPGGSGVFTPGQLERYAWSRTCETCGKCDNLDVSARYVPWYGKGCFRGHHCTPCWNAATTTVYLREEEDRSDRECIRHDYQLALSREGPWIDGPSQALRLTDRTRREILDAARKMGAEGDLSFVWVDE